MIIDCISDLHGEQPKLEGGDLLIIAGDLTARDYVSEHREFAEWVNKLPYEKVIIVAGNHDGYIKSNLDDFLSFYDTKKVIYLQDSGTEIDGEIAIVTKWGTKMFPIKLKIWGMPWTPPFCDWHFMADHEKMKEKVAMIPDDIDILITHGPPWGFLDYNNKREHCGCVELLERVTQMPKIKYHIFGHIHESYGTECARGITFVNASIMNGDYEAVNKPIGIEL